MDPVLVAENITRRFGDRVALDGVSLQLARGEIFGLIGPNGAGKTTLVRTLTGTTTPTEGSVTVLGDRPDRVDRSRIGLLPQEFDPPTRLTGREILAYYAGLYDDAQPIETVLSTVGMTEGADTRYDRLSGGQKRRICVGIALLNDPAVLFLDEPTTGIDPAGRRALWSVLTERATNGTAILLTTHDMTEAETLADRVGLIDGGQLLEVGDPGALVRRYGGASTLVVEGALVQNVLVAAGFDATETTIATDGDTVVRGIDPREIATVVEALESAGIEFDGVRWSPPTLETVYFSLTGDRYDPGEGPE